MSAQRPDGAWPDWVIEELAKHCTCVASHCPCDAVMAGGICDDYQGPEPEEPDDDEDSEPPRL